MDNKLSKSIYTGFLWQFLERILTQLIAFIVSLIIARILTPDDYGLVAMS